MNTRVIFQITRSCNSEDPAVPAEQIELLDTDGVLRLRDAGGGETACENLDVAAACSSTPSLRQIRAGDEVTISCEPEIAARLPLVLEPVLDLHRCLPLGIRLLFGHGSGLRTR